ncbi:Right handed beta helix region [Natronoarchaeum philippinense]|uniref:Right handed beta helix region n=1 Tax=Natronoarchaeum philippinense TaxID=558529 RepID=A0A285P635_NATPI|nr:right-handed parallel beta-helix repeat-containing protein [Natronoarchaeum philippinense]SNZ16908.1 Right handed beta helix region [Natronoarchaeum philippinense]
MGQQPDDDGGSKRGLTTATDDKSVSNASITDEDDANSGGYGRRSYLKLAGVATAGTALATLHGSATETDLSRAIVVDGSGTEMETEYEFSVTKAVADVDGIENTDDSIDGATVAGTVDGSRNAYMFSGTIEQFYVSGPADVRFGDDLDALVPDRLRSLSIDADSRLTYRFTTTGEISKTSTADGTERETDHTLILQGDDGNWTAFGCTSDDYADTFHFEGDIVEFCPLEGTHTVTLDGTSMTPYELVGEEPPQPDDGSQQDGGDQTEQDGSTDDGTQQDDSTDDGAGQDGTDDSTDDGTDDSQQDPVEHGDYLGGGGDRYPNTVAASAADYTVATESELQGAFGSAGSGDTVYVTADIEITETHAVPAGVTLASDRGIEGSDGARLHTSADSFPVLEAGDGVRVTGLTVQGPVEEFEVRQGYPVSTGVRVAGTNVEIDNCRLRGFSHASVEVQNHDTHVHHCDIRRNARDGLGYGVVIGSGHPTIEHCTFNYNRHSVATASGDGSFTIDGCWFGPDSLGLVIDHHGPNSDAEMYVRNVTVEATHKVDHPEFEEGGRESTAIGIRGSTSPGRLEVENSWFYDPEPEPTGEFGEAINFAQSADSWEAVNTTIQNCHFGDSEPDGSIGHPR